MRRLVLLLLLTLPALAWAEAPLGPADLAEIRAVINRQIDAFRRDDARGAFALASPGVQQAFGSAERFLDAVRASYRPVYRPSAFQFLELIVLGADAVQPVKVTDHRGAVWVAYYAMQRQPDGSWRTSGCRLVPPARTIPT